MLLNMSANLVKATIYFEQSVLYMEKIKALNQKRPLYKVVNEDLKAANLTVSSKKKSLTTKPFKFEEVFGTFNLGLGKRKFKRSWAYEEDERNWNRTS